MRGRSCKLRPCLRELTAGRIRGCVNRIKGRIAHHQSRHRTGKWLFPLRPICNAASRQPPESPVVRQHFRFNRSGLLKRIFPEECEASDDRFR
jgi:hypothetical protein